MRGPVASSSRLPLRSISTSSSRLATPAPSAVPSPAARSAISEDRASRSSDAARPRGSGSGPRAAIMPPFERWIQTAAKQYKLPPMGRGPFWIGSTPFPLNPTFKPSPPLPTYTRQALWAAHIAEPKGSGAPRALSTRFHIPIDRVEAVLRLCALEKEWVKERRPLQTHFASSMERLLGSPVEATLNKQRADRQKAASSSDASSSNAASSSNGRASGRVTPTAQTMQMQRGMKEDEPVPSLPGSSAEIRGPYREIVDEGNEPPSILEPALHAANVARGAKLAALPSNGPRKVRDAPTTVGTRVRAPLRIADVGPNSYAGAGVAGRNEARRVRRARATAKRMATIEGRRSRLEERVQMAREARQA
ncbi:hypothetical protein FA09DRAFT_329984 [Tilletiopsis washingtonensis]|uniref:Uncharacterized protein n=1 Tax=Tilletiopsis washingtonensis TaxID=58919 RepID=A0A316Z976_9BASI|nr:hypothetical protein FA09DRAFT_329984 [Tilletiopsis washingtonensis]PWN97826.1 hypothetical protein FA09DRAFT_329984 [Tilletiopsis washingtonensis]